MLSSGADISLRQGAILARVPFFALDVECPAIVVTPQCDIYQDKADTILCVAMFPAFEFIRKSVVEELAPFRVPSLAQALEAREDPGRGDLRQLRGRIDQLHRNQFPRFHWLDDPEHPGDYAVADFQYVTSLPFAFAGALAVAGALDDVHTSAFATRFAAYVTRIGTPDPDFEVLSQWTDELIVRVLSGE